MYLESKLVCLADFNHMSFSFDSNVHSQGYLTAIFLSKLSWYVWKLVKMVLKALC